ncbi:ArsR family transcriptional regulator [Candidatus Margulisiibacteriota bacterium]
MLEGIFGNQTAEKVLMHVYHYKEVHASVIAKDYKIALTPILNQLQRFEKAGVLVSRQIGRTKLYAFNEESPFHQPLKEIIRILHEATSAKRKTRLFKKSVTKKRFMKVH